MSPHISLKIRESLKNKINISDKKLDRLQEILSYYKVDNLIYPGLLIRKLNINMSEVYTILEELEKEGSVERNFEVYCSKCNKYTGGIYRSYKDIPEFLECEECFKELNESTDTIIIYRVINSE